MGRNRCAGWGRELVDRGIVPTVELDDGAVEVRSQFWERGAIRLGANADDDIRREIERQKAKA